MTSPSLAKVLRSQQPIHDSLKRDRKRRGIVPKLVNLTRRRRQADQGIGNASNQRDTIRIRDRFEATCLESF